MTRPIVSCVFSAIDFSIEDDEPETSDYDMNAMEVDQTTSTENTDQSRDKRKSEVKELVHYMRSWYFSLRLAQRSLRFHTVLTEFLLLVYS